MSETTQHPILLFDGHCNLCNGAVQWVLARDQAARFRFASLQSELGQQLQQEHDLNPKKLDSMVLIQDGKAYTRSSAALKTAEGLGGIYGLAGLFLFIPAFIRNSVYDFVARHRYRWFGRSEVCWLPRPEWKERFL